MFHLPFTRCLLHIPKTGGTWLADILAHNGFGPSSWRIRQLPHAFPLSKIDARFGTSTKFGFVCRDPVERLHSAFDSRRNFSRPTREYPWHHGEPACFARFETFDAFASAFGAGGEAEAAAEAALRDVPHFRRGLAYYFGNPGRLEAAASRVVFCATARALTAALPAFARAFRLPPLTIPPEARSHSSATFRTPLGDAGRAALRERLAGEYRLFSVCEQLAAGLGTVDGPAAGPAPASAATPAG